MLRDNDAILKSFVLNHSSCAAIRDTNGVHILVNKQWEYTFGIVNGVSALELLDKTQDELLKTNLQYCLWCDDEANHNRQPVVHFEVFGGKRFVTMRVPTVYQGKPVLVILLTRFSSVEPNQKV